MTEAAIAPVRALPLAEMPAQALRVAASFAAELVSIHPGSDGQVLVTGAQGSRGVEVCCDGQCTAEVTLPAAAVRAALNRLRDAEHASIVGGDDGLLTLRLYEPSSTLAMSMPSGGSGVRLPEAVASDQIGALAIDAGVLARAMAPLRGFGTLRIETFSQGWQLSGAAGDLTVRALVCGVLQK